MKKPHPYAYVVVVAIALALFVTLVVGAPHTLPAVALESEFLFHLERALAIVLVLFIAFVIVAQAWDGHLPKEISKDGLGYSSSAEQAAEDARDAAERTLGAERDVGGGEVPLETEGRGDLMELRMGLEAQMTYIAKWLLRDGDRVSYVTIGSLRYDGYLTPLEAEVAAQVLSLRDAELETLGPRQSRAFIADAGKVVRNLRAGVFFGLVREILKANDLSPEEIDNPPGPRPDLRIEHNGAPLLIVPRFVMLRSGSAIMDRAGRHLQEASALRPGERQLIVVPDRSKHESSEGEPGILKLAELKEKLGLAKDPRALD